MLRRSEWASSELRSISAIRATKPVRTGTVYSFSVDQGANPAITNFSPIVNLVYDRSISSSSQNPVRVLSVR